MTSPREGAARPEERQAHLLMWIRALPEDVDEKPAGMIKLLRHLIADMDVLRELVEEPGPSHEGSA